MSENENSIYARTGVDVSKKGINVFEENIRNLFPGAFCVVTKDPRLPEYGNILHTDGAGTKPVESYLLFKQSGDIDYFQSLAQDVIAMNLDDIYCVAAKPVSFVDDISINVTKVPKQDLLKTINAGFKKCFELFGTRAGELKDFEFGGGETADVPDIVRTLNVSGTIASYVKLSEAITGYDIKPGNLIVGLRSGGQTAFEKEPNSGIMCNGITLARHVLTQKEYAEAYPEIREPQIAQGYSGRFCVFDSVDGLGMTVGEAVVSPTRLYAPLLETILHYYRPRITGMVHNTGGGQTKCLRLGKNVHYVKQTLEIDPIFKLIQREGHVEWHEMFEDFNMGTGFEIFVDDKDTAEKIIGTAELNKFGAAIIGHVEKSDGKNKLTIDSPYGKFNYS
jgi:phosphoribosylformylglycinamidine cyclo-ligase